MPAQDCQGGDHRGHEGVHGGTRSTTGMTGTTGNNHKDHKGHKGERGRGPRRTGWTARGEPRIARIEADLGVGYRRQDWMDDEGEITEDTKGDTETHEGRGRRGR